jgi:hypothetical protein
MSEGARTPAHQLGRVQLVVKERVQRARAKVRIGERLELGRSLAAPGRSGTPECRNRSGIVAGWSFSSSSREATYRRAHDSTSSKLDAGAANEAR